MNEINAGTIPTLMKSLERDGKSWKATLLLVGLIWISATNQQTLLSADDYQKVSFDALKDFPCGTDEPYKDPTDETCEIPTNVKELDGASVSVKGFMIPLEADDQGRISTFVLVGDQMSCCFGGSPQLNAWIFVKMKPKTYADFVDYVPVTVYGKLEVGLSKIKDQVMSLYRLEGDLVKAPKS